MTKNYFEVLDSSKMPNILFSESFMMRGKKLKFVTTDGKILSKDSSLRLSRYMRISNVIETVNGRLRFDMPTRWADPFEKLFYQNIVTVGNKTYHVVCLCFINDVNEGEESLWHVHGDINNNYKRTLTDFKVRASFNVQTLCTSLSKSNIDTTFYFAPIDYSLTRDQILQRYQKRKNVPYTTIEEFIDDMLVKRKAFSYENEIRLFAVSEKSFNIVNNFSLMKLNKYSKSVITSVTLPPIPITPSYNKLQYHNDLSKQKGDLKSVLNNNNYNMTIRQSRLYDIVKYHQ